MNNGKIILYQADDSIQIEVRLDDETVWLTQEQIALLFGKSRSTITGHINNIFREGELYSGNIDDKRYIKVKTFFM